MLLAHELEQDPDNVYRALLTVMLRLVFLLYAEERGLLSEDPTFAGHYSVGGLYERLREDAGLYPDTMNDRYGAWAQLLVLFRMVHDGAKSGGMRLPARRGDLFSPSRFPFLEGWHGSGKPQVTQGIEVPLVPDGTIRRVLDKLLVLDGERISYRALDVEQIGSVYETMMGFRLETATGRSVAIKAQKKGGASTTVDLEELVEVAPAARAKWVRDRTERRLTATVTRPLRVADGVTGLHAALARVVDGARVDACSGTCAPGTHGALFHGMLRIAHLHPRASEPSPRTRVRPREHGDTRVGPEMTWTNQHRRVFTHRKEGYECVPPHGYPVSDMGSMRDDAVLAGSRRSMTSTSRRPDVE